MNAARTIYWPDPSWSAMQARAEALGVSVSAFIRRAVEVYDGEAVAQREQGQPRRQGENDATRANRRGRPVVGEDVPPSRAQPADDDRASTGDVPTHLSGLRQSGRVRGGSGSDPRGSAPRSVRVEGDVLGVTPRQPRVQGPITKADSTRRKGK